MNLDIGLILAIVGTGIAVTGVIIAMFFWIRSEANNDRRHFQDIQREDRRELLGLIYAIQEEVKDFHHRLIEARK